MTREDFINWFEERFALTKNDIYEFGQLYDEVKKPHWISVDDELPKEHGRYLVVNGVTKEQEVFVYSNGIWWYNAYRCPNGIVTHWMRLPQPPKEGGEV